MMFELSFISNFREWAVVHELSFLQPSMVSYLLFSLNLSCSRSISLRGSGSTVKNSAAENMPAKREKKLLPERNCYLSFKRKKSSKTLVLTLDMELFPADGSLSVIDKILRTEAQNRWSFT